MEGWSSAREFITRERASQELLSLLSKSRTTYVLEFDKSMQLTFINNCYPEHIGHIFKSDSSIPGAVVSSKLALSEVINMSFVKENLTSLISKLIDAKEWLYVSQSSDYSIRLVYDDSGHFSKMILLINYKDNIQLGPGWSVNFILQPIEKESEPATTMTSPKPDQFIQHYLKAKQKGNHTEHARSDSFKLTLKNSGPAYGNQGDSPASTFKRVQIPFASGALIHSPVHSTGERSIGRAKIRKGLLTSSKTINFEDFPGFDHSSKAVKLHLYKDFDSDDDDIKQVKQSETDWENRFRKSIAMEYYPDDNLPRGKNSMTNILQLPDKQFMAAHIEATSPSQFSGDLESQIIKKKLLDLKKSEVDQVLQEMEDKLKFYEDIVDIDTLVKHQVPMGSNYLTDWNFCSLDLTTKLDKVCVVRDIFNHFSFFSRFDIKEQVFLRFMWEVGYFYTRHKNPFHNFAHGINVVHSGFYLLWKYPKFANVMNEEQRFGFLISCLAHDLDHRGKTNMFEVVMKTDLALTYNDISPLEQHHAAVLFKILSVKNMNIMHAIKDEKWRQLKKEMVENILATDMKSHFSMLTKFKQQLLTNASFGTQSPCGEQDRQLICSHFIHFADLSGSFKEMDIANRWSRLVNSEFTEQVVSSSSVCHGGRSGHSHH
jgi:hypothetical protein